jgi:demethylmenaquinone methyltransferase / 2-methoxy-6-polyprenyl-1,4-benzoquinol methylase
VTTVPVRPHPTLAKYYATDDDRAGMVRHLFDSGAPHYEWVCKFMSMGTGEKYRAECLVKAGLTTGMRVLDVATGTGLVLRSAAALVGPTGAAIGLDPSSGMLRENRAKCVAPLVQARGEHLPFANASFDMVCMGYALRHVFDLNTLFAEYTRVLKPGGRVMILELTQPRSAPARWLNRFFLQTVVPGVAQLSTGRPEARRMMDYFWDTIEHCVPPETILASLREAGFDGVTRDVRGNVLSQYLATRR